MIAPTSTEEIGGLFDILQMKSSQAGLWWKDDFIHLLFGHCLAQLCSDVINEVVHERERVELHKLLPGK